jgi:hypothetical protein
MTRIATAILLLTLPLTLCACGSHLAGVWDGTADIGPIDAFALTVEFPQEGLEGDIAIVETGGKVTYHVCKSSQQGDRFVLHWDAAWNDCKERKDRKSDPGRLVGVAGEGAIFGEVFKGARRVGFFRAFRRPPPEPALKVE